MCEFVFMCVSLSIYRLAIASVCVCLGVFSQTTIIAFVLDLHRFCHNQLSPTYTSIPQGIAYMYTNESGGGERVV